MKTIYHAADSRGGANHGWLKTRHTFSFADYYDPNRMGFGALRVINDDHIEGGGGFGMHPHRDMEIITFMLNGDLRHTDSMGNTGVITDGEIQVMSAGTGVFHSEENERADRPAELLQIWVLPHTRNVLPRYEQMRIADEKKVNEFQQIVSPNPHEPGLWIHQNAWFNLAEFTTGNSRTYNLHRTDNGVYVFVISGKVKVGSMELSPRDGLGVYDADAFELTALTDARVLLMEVPMR